MSNIEMEEINMAGTWKPLKNQPPFNASTMLLLTDGSVMVQEEAGKNWWRLSPDAKGDYVNGTWAALSAMKNTREYFASAVLADGRVFVAGGEYSDGGGDLNAAEMFDPVWDLWTSLPTPPGWTNIGDAPCAVLPDGRLLLGNIFTNDTAIYDPLTDTWTAAAKKHDHSSEETWTLLPDETVLTVECSNHPQTEKYLAVADKWVNTGTTPSDLVQPSSIEIGPALLLPDGRIFAIGASGHTALYTPPALASQPGIWTAGPDIPRDVQNRLMKAKDAPGVLMPNGKVLFTAGPAGDAANDWPFPTYFFEYDGVSINPVSNPSTSNSLVYEGRLLLIPSGQVLFACGINDIEVYTPDGFPDEDWRPEITSVPTFLRLKQTYTLQGRLLNGLSQANSYGDDASMATNYPLVKIRNLKTGHMRYARTFDHSSMSVATGLSIQSTHFKIPFGAELGESELCVVANGIQSECVRVNIAEWHLRIPITEGLVNRLIGSLADGPLWVLGPDGPVPVPGPGDPWADNVRKQAEAAHADILRSIKVLQTLGQEVVSHRTQAAARVDSKGKAKGTEAHPSGDRRRAEPPSKPPVSKKK
jgi:hypothetical protein